MMGVSEVFIFALLQIFILYTGVNSNITGSSNHHHHLHPRGSDENPLEIKRYLELVESKDPPKDAVLVSDDSNNDYYILGSKKCNKAFEIIKSSEISSKGANKAVREFLVNKDDFEILDWKSWAEIESGKIPFYAVMFCKIHLIAKDNNGIRSVTPTFLKQKKNMQTEVLSVNYDIIGQHLEIYEYVIKEEEKSERVETFHSSEPELQASQACGEAGPRQRQSESFPEGPHANSRRSDRGVRLREDSRSYSNR